MSSCTQWSGHLNPHNSVRTPSRNKATRSARGKPNSMLEPAHGWLVLVSIHQQLAVGSLLRFCNVSANACCHQPAKHQSHNMIEPATNRKTEAYLRFGRSCKCKTSTTLQLYNSTNGPATWGWLPSSQTRRNSGARATTKACIHLCYKSEGSIRKCLVLKFTRGFSSEDLKPLAEGDTIRHAHQAENSLFD